MSSEGSGSPKLSATAEIAVPIPQQHELINQTSMTTDSKGRPCIATFRDMVEYTDFLVGRIIRKVTELGLADNTLMLFTGDNGTSRRIVSRMEGLGEYPGGKGGMWVPGTHVPLLAVGGSSIDRGRVCDSLVDFSDFVPTLAEAAGVPTDRCSDLDGHSFFHHLTGKDGFEREWIYCHYAPWVGRYGVNHEGP